MQTLKKLVNLCNKIQSNDNEDIHIVKPCGTIPEKPSCLIPCPKTTDDTYTGNVNLDIWSINSSITSVNYRTVVSILPGNCK